MLREFLALNREKLIEHCQTLAAERGPISLPTEATHHGVPKFLDQLIDILPSHQGEGKTDTSAKAVIVRAEKQQATKLTTTAKEHGRELFERGDSIDQVVHAYGDVCQAVTELATDVDSMIITSEFQLLNHCLDNAIAAAVTEFDKRRHQLVWESRNLAMNARLQDFAQEVRLDVDRRESIALQKISHPDRTS